MKKITLLFAILALTSTVNAQNYGMRATGEWAQGFYSDDIQSLLSTQSAFTIEFWYQIEVFKPNTWIFYLEDSATNRIGLLTDWQDSGIVFVRIGDGTSHGQQMFSTNELTANWDWNHVALTFNAGVVKLYINGLEVTGGGIAGAYPYTTGDYSGIQFRTGWTTDANIDELRITKGVALSSIDIAKSSSPGNFDAYFDFNANERPVGASGTNSETANIGSDATVKGYVNGLAETYEVFDNSSLKVKGFDKVNPLPVFPNPTSDHVNIQLPSYTSGKVFIYSITGKLLLEKMVTDQNEVRVNTSFLSKGIYMLSFENETIKKVSKLIIK